MNGKLLKKLRKEGRREVRKHFDTLDAVYFIKNYLKPKPRYCPKFIWNFFTSLLLQPKPKNNEIK